MRSTDLAISFFTVLTLAANLATLAIAGLAVSAQTAPDAWSGRTSRQLRAELAASRHGGVAWLVAAVCMSGSLWFSEVAGFQPCRLCWVQRAFMYPLVVVLAVPALRRRLALWMAGAGALVATYHVLVERFPSLESGACDPATPCSLVWFERLGFVTLPYMALSGFVLIATLLLASRPTPHEALS